MKQERRKHPATEIYVAVIFSNEITDAEQEFLNKIKKEKEVNRVFIVTDVPDHAWSTWLSTDTGYRADRVNLTSIKEAPRETWEETIADVIHILTMRGHPKRHVYLQKDGPNVESYGLDLEKVKKTLEEDKKTKVVIL